MIVLPFFSLSLQYNYCSRGEMAKNASKMPSSQNGCYRWQESYGNCLNGRRGFRQPRDYRIQNRDDSLGFVEVPVGNVEDFVDIYEWRRETEYPIIGCAWKGVLLGQPKNIITNRNELASIIPHLQKEQHAIIMVQTQQVFQLEMYEPLSAANFIYTLKEALVGFERLFALFGSFEVSQRMVAVDDQGRVKVWISPQYDQNTKGEIDQSKLYTSQERYMVGKIKDIFMRFAYENSTFREFFKGADEIISFLQFFRFIEDFSGLRKIVPSKRLLKKKNKTVRRPLSPVINLKPIARTPKFIASMQSSIHKKREEKCVPSLLFGYRDSNQKPRECHFSELKTKETIEVDNQEDIISLPVDTKRTLNSLFKVRSQKYLNERQYFQVALQQSNIEKCFDLLFEQQRGDAPCQTGLYGLGKATESIVMQ